MSETPPPSKWLYALLIVMTTAVIVAFLGVIYGVIMTVQDL